MDRQGLIPRKQLRPRLRRDLSIQPQRFDRQTCYLVKDPVRLAYFRFEEPEYFLMRLMDGRHTLADAQAAFERRFRPQRLALEEVEAFAHQLVTTGLASVEASSSGERLLDQGDRLLRRRRLAALGNCLAFKLPLLDPDRLLARMLAPLRWLFTPAFFVASVALWLAALLLVATQFDAFRERLPTFHGLLASQSVVCLVIAFTLVKVVHEFGHGLAAKALGSEVHEIGVMFFCGIPCLYCDVTDSWTLPSKWQRMAVGFAGIHAELLIASLATFVWWQSLGQPWLNPLCLGLMVVCSVNTLIFNGNPLLRLDGYFILADWLEIPNLREQCDRFVRQLVLRHGLGIDVLQQRLPGRWRGLFAVYALACPLYRWQVACAVLWFLHMTLQRWGLAPVGVLLVALVVGSMLVWPLVCLVQEIHQHGRWPNMSLRRALLGSGLVTLLVVATVALPLPVASIRQTGLVRVCPDSTEKVYPPLPGVLVRLHVRNGQRVVAGEMLADFRNRELDDALEEARTQRDIAAVHLTAWHDRSVAPGDPEPLACMAPSLARAAADRNRRVRAVEQSENMLRRLEVRAPRAGVVMGLPDLDSLGACFDNQQATPFCCIADPTRLQALVPLTSPDYRLLRGDRQQTAERGVALPSTIQVPGRGMRARHGRVSDWPDADAREVPLALTTRGGGPVPVQDAVRTPGRAPKGQHYLVAVDILDPDDSILPGTLVQVKFHCRWRTGWWWLRQTFFTTWNQSTTLVP